MMMLVRRDRGDGLVEQRGRCRSFGLDSHSATHLKNLSPESLESLQQEQAGSRPRGRLSITEERSMAVAFCQAWDRFGRDRC